MNRRDIVISACVALLLVSGFLPSTVLAQDQGQGVDVVLILDTSGAMLDQFDRMCTTLTHDLTGLQNLGFNLHVTFLGITNSYNCAKTSVSGSIVGATVTSNDDWGPAVADVAARFTWRPDTVRVIIPISNQGPAHGDPVEDPGDDRSAIQRAIKAAQSSQVIVSPLLGVPDRAARPDDRAKLDVLADDLAKATGGHVAQLSASVADPTSDILQLVARAVPAAGGGPMLAIPGAVHTLTCQRDTVKCISLDPGVLLTNAGLAVLFTVILGFATAVMNMSLAQVHTPQVEGRIATALSMGATRLRRGFGALFAPEAWTTGTPAIRRGASIVLAVAFVGLTALIASFLDPTFNPGTPRGVATFAAVFVAVGLINLSYVQVQLRTARSRACGAAPRIRPFNVVVMALAVLVSRSINFLPGFLIGLPMAYALLADTDTDEVETRMASAGLISVIVVAVITWLLAIPIDLVMGNLLAQLDVANPTSLGVDLLGALQSGVLMLFVVAIELAFVALWPVAESSGQRLYAGSRWRWGLGFGTITFFALGTIFNPTLSGFDVFQNPALLIVGSALAILTGVALSVWLSVNQQRLSESGPIDRRSVALVLGILGAWLLVCMCGAITFVTRSVSWVNVLVVVLVLAILAGGGFVAVRARAGQVASQATAESQDRQS